MTTRESLAVLAIVCWVILFVWLVLPMVGVAIANVRRDRREAADAAKAAQEQAEADAAALERAELEVAK